jgi:hypothetical protein
MHTGPMQTPPARRPLVVTIALLLALAGCGGPSEIRTVADFDAAPCLLLPGDTMRQVISEPYRNLVGSEPKLVGDPRAAGSDGSHACVYEFQPSRPPSRVPPVASLTVTVEHAASGSQPLAICVAGAANNAPGYKIQPVGDQACLSPSSDLWLRLGQQFFHVVLVPQPGFTNPVDMNLALSSTILAVGRAAASRMPKA